MEKKLVSSGTPWEEKVGYSRAVRVGPFVEVSGTVSAEGGTIIGEGSAYDQARFIFSKIEKALMLAGATMQNVVRTRMYLTNIQDFEEVTRAHAEFFSKIRPASTLVEVSGFVDPKFLVEIEVSAIIEE
ncbi:MAG: RidA family protein [Saprospiraceae bacterium]|nr:RidA family protein [Saprospiraceae bacterium]